MPSNRRRRIPAAALVLVLVPLLTSACLESVVQVSFSGSFNLRTFNQEQLPYVERVNDCTLSLEGGTLFLYNDDTFAISLDAHTEGAGCSTAARFPKLTTGDYLHDAVSVTFQHMDGTSSTGTFQGNSVTWYLGSGVYEFVR